MPTHRTRHLDPGGSPRFTNRLILEASPYLLQHAHNPVDWHPWGDEAFETAKKQGKPVFLSIGYSTCHWCHVMEEESFEDLEIASFLNENFVSIKVDREERPDVDAIYMAATQALTGGGGWPMSVWLTPEKREPFHVGTYFPARDGDRGARMGFLTVLRELKRVYGSQRERVARTAHELARAIRERLAPIAAGPEPGREVLDRAFHQCARAYDEENGGFEGAPKFPSSMPIRFLLRYHRRTQNADSLRMAVTTLRRMAAGGIRDQVGGGFHRYSTDSQWRVPHFEKMLYDNALLAIAYVEGYQATGDANLARVAREILDDMIRDYRSSEGAFYSATDADSQSAEGRSEEGWFFTWTETEIDDALPADQATLAKELFGVTPEGNFEGRTVLRIAREPKDGERVAVARIGDRMREVRARRPAPNRDEKILAAWNALMISALARAGFALGAARYVDAARSCADFVFEKLFVEGRLQRAYKDGKARRSAYLDDHAFLLAASLDLFEATGERRWLERAMELEATLAREFEDVGTGAFFQTAHDHEILLAREKPAHDGAEPSGNSVAALSLLRLHAFTDRRETRARAERAIRALSGVLAQSPLALGELLLAVDLWLDPPTEIAIFSPPGSDPEPLLSVARRAFLPSRALAVAQEDLADLVPWLAGKQALDGRATAFVCRGGACQVPTAEPEMLGRQLHATFDPHSRAPNVTSVPTNGDKVLR